VNAGTLSGGNLQKVILARELSNNPKLLICSQPTRGLDVGAVENIQNMLIDARNKGISIVLISTELDEILSLSDRVAVIFEGKIVDVIKNDEKIDIGLVGLMMAGGKDGNKYVVGGAAI
jgi:simple sugar transport system ATP-binding protein